MSEWIKILITAVLGLLAGVSAEPLRNSLARRLTAKRALKMLYQELAIVYEFCRDAVHVPEETLKEAFPRIQFEHFDFYYDQHREAFYLIPQHQSLSGLFKGLTLILNDGASGKLEPSRATAAVVHEIDLRIEGHTLDKQLFDNTLRSISAGSKRIRAVLQEDIFRVLGRPH